MPLTKELKLALNSIFGAQAFKTPSDYTIKYKKRVTIGDSVEERLTVKECDLLDLLTILSQNGYKIISVKEEVQATKPKKVCSART